MVKRKDHNPKTFIFSDFVRKDIGIKIFFGLIFILFIFVFVPQDVSADCLPSPSGNTVIDTACSFSGTVNGVDTGTGSTNTAVIEVTTGGTLTISAGQTLATGSLSLTGGSIVVVDTGQIKIGMPLWMVDCDADGYTSGETQYAQTSAPGCGVRRNTLSSYSTDCNDNKNYRNVECPPWYNASWAYRDEVTVTNSGSGLSNYQMLYQVDTASLVSAGRLQADCDDLRFTDSNGTTLLTYWIEADCNTSNTQIWITIPSIPVGSKRIFMYYSNAGATAGTQSWAGSFVAPSNASCPSGWTRFSSLDSRFPRGATTPGGTGGTSSHTHTFSGTTGTDSGAVYKARDDPLSYTYQPARINHTHSFSDTTNSADHTPPYLDMIFCSASAPISLLPTSFVVFYNASVPSGWTRFTSLDNRFPRGAASYGGTGGLSTHTHSNESVTTGGPSILTKVRYNGSALASSTTHTHTFTLTFGSANNLPPYLDIVAMRPNATSAFEQNAITMVTSAVPPQGWTQFSALDSKFPRGATTYGGTGGSDTHTQPRNAATTGDPSASGYTETWTSIASSSYHTHSVSSGTTNSANHTPPYYNLIFVQRNGSSPTTTVPISGEPYPP